MPSPLRVNVQAPNKNTPAPGGKRLEVLAAAELQFQSFVYADAAGNQQRAIALIGGPVAEDCFYAPRLADLLDPDKRQVMPKWMYEGLRGTQTYTPWGEQPVERNPRVQAASTEKSGGLPVPPTEQPPAPVVPPRVGRFSQAS